MFVARCFPLRNLRFSSPSCFPCHFFLFPFKVTSRIITFKPSNKNQILTFTLKKIKTILQHTCS